MDVGAVVDHLICRMCLCKCENPRNMLVDTDFANKVMEVFSKVEISPENGFPNICCDYCHNLIQQFHGYFETVNANQDELRKSLILVQKEEVFAVPIECFSEKEENFTEEVKIEGANDCSDDDTGGWFDDDPPAVATESLPTAHQRKSESPSDSIKYTKEQCSNMTYSELNELPLNFTCSFVCPLCPGSSERYSRKGLVKEHIIQTHVSRYMHARNRSAAVKRHLETVDARCDRCNKILPSSKESTIHQDHKFAHYHIKPYKCDVCDHFTNNKEYLRAHVLRHETETQMTCDLCGQALMGKRAAIAHFVEHKRQKFMLECERCPGGIKFPDERVLALHKAQHKRKDQTKKAFGCYLCERTFDSQMNYKSHLNLHAVGTLIACDICGKTSVVHPHRKISNHMRTHMKEAEVYKCKECGEEFDKKVTLTRHISKMHDRKERSCYRCGKMIAAFLMKRHLNYCKAGEIRCIHCPMVFAKSSARVRHTQEVHIGFKCLRCNIPFENRTQLQYHRRYDDGHLNQKRKKQKTK